MNEIHIMDGRSRVARVREHVSGTWTGTAPEPMLYNLEDHLGNSSFTLTYTGAGHSREEYFPFGESSFGSFGKKRYRFCGKERDEESGLYNYGARYYAAWTCRFVSIDPLAVEMPFFSPYCYAANSPVCLEDVDGLAPGGGGGGGSGVATKTECVPNCDSPDRVEKTLSMEYEFVGNRLKGKVTATLSIYENGELVEYGSQSEEAEFALGSIEQSSFLNSFDLFATEDLGKGAFPGFYNSAIREGRYNPMLRGIQERFPPFTSGELTRMPMEVVTYVAREANSQRNFGRIEVQGELTESGKKLSKIVEGNRDYEFLLKKKTASGKSKATALNEIIRGAAKSNKMMKWLARGGKYGGGVIIAWGAYNSFERLRKAATGESSEPIVKVAAEEYWSWGGAIAGAELGASAGIAVYGWWASKCPEFAPPGLAIGFSFVGGLIGGVIGGFVGNETGTLVSKPFTSDGKIHRQVPKFSF